MEIIKKEHIFIDVDLKTKLDAFEFIAKKAESLKLVDDYKILIKGFTDREKESSTGFEDGFAIPHTRIDGVKQNAVIIVKSLNGIEWESFDGKPINSIIALIVKNGANDTHLEILSSVSVKLMDENFKTAFKNSKTVDEVFEAFFLKKVNEDKINNNVSTSKKIVAITSCTAGIAHTYLAEEKLLQAGRKLGINMRVETQGSKGVGTPLTEKEIKEADAVIFGVDLGVDKSRFVGKKFIETKVANIIHNPEQYIEQALVSTKLVNVNSGNNDNFEVKQRDNLMKHILTGVSYMIPIVVLGGICLAVSLGIAKSIWGPNAGTDGPYNTHSHPHGILNALSIIGGVAFTMMIPILGGFIANSIAGRAAIAPAMVVSFIGNSTDDLFPWTFIKNFDTIRTPMGFIGAILAGILAGYLVKWINTWKIPKSLQAAMPIFFIPLSVGILLSLFFIYILGAPIGWLMEKIEYGIGETYGANITYNSDGKAIVTSAGSNTVGVVTTMLIGAVLGAMGGFDMGGPVNKIAFVTCSILTAASATEGIEGTAAAEALQKPMGSLACAIPVAPLGMGLTTLIFPKFFDKESKNMGVGAIIMGSIGISEGAIPFAIRDPKRAILCNVIGSAIAGGIGGALGVQDAAAHGGPIVAALGAIPYGKQTLYFIIAASAGVAITCSLYGFWLLKDAGRFGSVKETHNLYLEKIRNNFIEEKSKIKEDIYDLNNQKASIKLNAKLEKIDKSDDIANINQKINKLKNELKESKNHYKILKNNSMVVYKEMAKQENKEFRQDKKQIKEFIYKIKSIKSDEISQLRKIKSNQTFDNKKQKINYIIEYKNNINASKESYINSLKEEFTNKSANYVLMYKQKVNF